MDGGRLREFKRAIKGVNRGVDYERYEYNYM